MSFCINSVEQPTEVITIFKAHCFNTISRKRLKYISLLHFSLFLSLEGQKRREPGRDFIIALTPYLVASGVPGTQSR